MHMDMKIFFLGLLTVFSLSLTGCKLLKTHTIKLTSSPVLVNNNIEFATTIGWIYLSTSNLGQKDQNILLGLHPFQCLEIKSSQAMNMQNRHAYFNDFKFRTLLESQSECRKIKVNKRISMR